MDAQGQALQGPTKAELLFENILQPIFVVQQFFLHVKGFEYLAFVTWATRHRCTSDTAHSPLREHAHTGHEMSLVCRGL